MNKIFTVLVSALCLWGASAVQSHEHGEQDIVAKGEEIFLARCDYCHGVGPFRPATLTLGRRYKDAGIPGPLAERTNLTPELIEFYVRNATPSMAPIRKTEVTDEELSWLAAYLTRNNP